MIKTEIVERMGRVAEKPVHVAIIMDGNGRWAKRRGLPRTFGHRAGVETLKSIIEACPDMGIRYLSVYAFSTENWKRPKNEISALMGLLIEYIEKELEHLNQKGVRVQAVGDVAALAAPVRRQLAKAWETTRNNDTLYLQVALNYGGRAEIVGAVKALAAKAREDASFDIGAIDQETVRSHMYCPQMPDPDLVIRTGGEYRISNFFLWQIAYSELWVTSLLWPDFTPAHLEQALKEYTDRDRRYGGVENA
jgi:undecaprenyl diphosphate synthase